MKNCCKCKKTFLESMFYKARKRTDGLQSMCKKCSDNHRLDWQRKNKEHVNEYKKSRRKERREWFQELKKSLRCELCGESRWYCLEFHHCDFGEKENEVSNMVSSGAPRKKILEEILKCQVLCANCHKEVTFLRIQSMNMDKTIVFC